MKRITFSGGSIVTSDAITKALLDYTTSVADAENSVTVDITVLEMNGDTSVHTLLLSPASQFDVADVGGISDKESDRFPVPDLPPVGISAGVEVGPEAADRAAEIDRIMADIDEAERD
ncbi:hypothetical protein [Clavibacter michiganensis]|uniref:Uncharacterized protein n=1 Tax=Clavibacter michiganensis TaxID=28447 RepID=A0A251YFY5_9MICO|nr:hypothetical protein [Clavibacter michiganensis]OUE23116.1 hypothetical protein BFL37_14245 [Clavibacter michiganensis]